MDMIGEDCIEVGYSTDDLVNFVFEDGLITSHDFDLKMDLDNVNDQPLHVVRLSNAQHHAQMLSHFIMNN